MHSPGSVSDHIDSYYTGSMTPAERYPQITGTVEVDTCVIGGGLAGLTLCRELAQAARPVALLEARRLGWAASGRNGGFVLPGFAEDIGAIERKVGRDHARELWGLSVEGVDYVRKAAADLNPAGVQSGGFLAVQRTDDHAAAKRSVETQARDYDYNREVWPIGRVREVLHTTAYFQGMYDPSAFHIHPLNYVTALAGDAAGRGTRIFETSPATRLEQGRTGWTVHTPTGAVSARNVVLASNVSASAVWRPVDRAVLPVATYMVASEPMEDELAQAIRLRGCIGDMRRAGDYYRRTGDGRLLWGGKITTSQTEPSRLADMLKRDINAIYPQLTDLRIASAWSGLMGYAVHKMPLVGAVGNGLWMCTAFGGHGLNTTAIAGCLIARAIASGDDRWKLFAPYRPVWAGGTIGRGFVQLAYWRMRLADRLKENRIGLNFS